MTVTLCVSGRFCGETINGTAIDRVKFKAVKVELLTKAVCTTVVILINATTLMHKSNLSKNNFGNNHFGPKYQKQKILRIFRRLHWCLFEKIPTKKAKTRKYVFGQIFHSFENFVTLRS